MTSSKTYTEYSYTVRNRVLNWFETLDSNSPKWLQIASNLVTILLVSLFGCLILASQTVNSGIRNIYQRLTKKSSNHTPS